MQICQSHGVSGLEWTLESMASTEAMTNEYLGQENHTQMHCHGTATCASWGGKSYSLMGACMG